MRGNVLVTGASGQLGTELRMLHGSLEGCSFFFTDAVAQESGCQWSTAVLDITDADAVISFVAQNQIDVIVNCAAYTNVDKAEDDCERADLINNKGVANLASAAKQAGAALIHISTDYVFGGEGNVPYTEQMQVAPLGVYGVTKLLGENAIKGVMGEDGDFVILRTAWLYSQYGNNFMKTMLRLTAERENINVVFDQVGTPTYAADLAQVILECIRLDKLQGIYHFSNEGVCSWYDFALEIAKLSGHDKCKISPCHSDEFPSKVKRPSYSVLDKTKIKQALGIEIPHWKESLERCLERCQERFK
ncbi:MAG: dTDP-4-dehydrorhamnose reductase [Bacteroidales bacterium]|nr:dTDP-4-dehydrorhamnose reductase [Bacteroidales bacterium]